jgi:hypothetical protein
VNVADSPFLKPYVGKPAVLDSNLLLLDWCFRFDPRLIVTFKRLNSFQVEDAKLLAETLKVFSAIRTTPDILTEVSNLASQLPRWLRDDWSVHFSDRVQSIPEEWTSAKDISLTEPLRLGLTDSALSLLARTHVVLTTDFPLSNSLQTRQLNAVNFTHLRSLWLE